MAGTCAHVEFLCAQPASALALAAVGLLMAVRAAVRLGKPLSRRYGAWAVVTGATDGIGRAIAFRLAAAGLGLVLVGRNPEKLAAVAAEIKAKHPKVPEVRTFVLDIGSGSASVIPSDPMYTIYAATKA